MENHITPMKAGIKYGVYLGIAISIFAMIAHYAGLQDYSSAEISSTFLVSALTWIILFALFYLGIKYFKDNNEGHLTLGEGMTTALFTGLVSGIISIIFTYLFFTFLAPEVMEMIAEAARESATADLSELSEEDRAEAEKMLGSMMGMVTSPIFMALSTFISRMFSAVIFGLIASLILKTD